MTFRMTDRFDTRSGDSSAVPLSAVRMIAPVRRIASDALIAIIISQAAR